MQTSDENIYAIGDVALRREQSIAVESVHNAQESAAIAAAAIAGVDGPNIQTPWFWSDQYDAKLQSVGIVPVQDDNVYQVERPGKRDGAVSFWSYRGEELVAVEVVNDPATYMEPACPIQRFPDPKQISNPSYHLSIVAEDVVTSGIRHYHRQQKNRLTKLKQITKDHTMLDLERKRKNNI